MDFNASKAQLLDLLPQLTCYKCESFPRADGNNKYYRCLEAYASHLLCENCKETCDERYCDGEEVSQIPCPLILRLLEMLPFCCKNRKNGCEEIQFAEKMKSHHAECVFEEVKCINSSCAKKMPFIEALDHLSDDCKKNRSKIEKGAKLKLPLKEKYSDYWHPHEIESNPLDKPLFYAVGKHQNGIAHIWIYYFGLKMEANRFSYSLEVGEETSYFTKFVGPVKSIVEDYEDIMKARDVFMISVSALQRICNEDNIFECVLNIIDKKAESQDSDEDSGVSEEQ